MIKMISKRDNGGHISSIESERSVATALLILVNDEIGFSGRLTQVEPTAVTVTTHVFGAVDVTEFTGTEEEMKPLYQAAVIDTIMQDEKSKIHGQGPSKSEIGLLMKITKGNPLLLNLGTGFFLGGPRAKSVYVGMMNPTKKEIVDQMLGCSMKDLHAMVVMKFIDNVPQDQIEALLA